VALTHLCDTSVLTRMRKPEVRQRVRTLLTTGALARCVINDLELGASARNGTEWESIMAGVMVFPELDLEHRDLVKALRVQRALADAGLRGRKLPDLMAAALAERAELVVLHYDHDFEHIGRITGQPHEWVVPAGSVD
jgi:predicted nucleic acid-binding protein